MASSSSLAKPGAESLDIWRPLKLELVVEDMIVQN